MPNQSLQQVLLSKNALKLKELFKQHANEVKSSREKALKGAAVSTSVLKGVSEFFQVVSSAVKAAGQSIPYVGQLLIILSSIPKAIAIVLDKSKSTQQRVLAGSLIALALGLAIAAMVLGAVMAISCGIVLTAVAGIFESAKLVGLVLNRNKLNKLGELHQQFEQLVSKKQNVKLELDDRYNELLARELVKAEQNKEDAAKINFLKQIVQKKKLNVDDYPSVLSLKALYQKKEEQIKSLNSEFKAFESAKSEAEKEGILATIQQVKKELYTTQTEIDALTKTSDTYKKETAVMNKNIAVLSVSIGLSAGGCALGIISVLMLVGLMAAPPLAIAVLAGVGIAMATAGLLRFFTEKTIEYDNKVKKELKKESLEDNLLNQALVSYDKSMQKQQQLEPEPKPVQSPKVEDERSIEEIIAAYEPDPDSEPINGHSFH